MKFVKSFFAIIVFLFIIAAIFLYKDEIAMDVVDAKYTSVNSQFLQMSNGAKVHYRDEGNASGYPLVLVHGSNASLHTWEPWVSLLGDDYRIISLDLPGHGLTGGVPDGDYSSAAQVNTVKAVVDELNIDAFALGGNSMGGGVTWRYAIAYPAEVEAMILVDASGPSAWWLEQESAQAEEGEVKEAPLVFKLLGQPWFRVIARYIDPYELVVQGVKSSYNNSPVVDQTLIDRYYELSLREGTRDATLSRFGGPRNSNETVDLSVLDQPTLVMWGKEDSLIPVDTVDKFLAVLPNAQSVLYENVGHMPMEEIPEPSAADVRAFLKSALSQTDVLMDES